MSGPKSSYYDIAEEQRRLLEERRREEEERSRREEEERRRREEEERRRREEEERRRREEEERRRREEEEHLRREEEERHRHVERRRREEEERRRHEEEEHRHRKEEEYRRREEEERRRHEEEEHRYRKEEEHRRHEEEERRHREEEEHRRHEEEEHRHREEEEHRRHEEEERRRHEEEERHRREEEVRQIRIKNADCVIDKAFDNFQMFEEKSTENPSIQDLEVVDDFEGREFSNRLNFLMNDLRLSTALITTIAETKKIFEKISDLTYRKNFIAIKIIPLLKKCEDYLTLYENTADLQIEYKVVCGMANETEKIFELSQSSIQEIKSEIVRLRKKIADDDKKFYIKKCLDEVMSDMGYNIIGQREVTKKNGKHFKNELFSYTDGTAVNVTLADDGNIAMELCGLDDRDRIPEIAESEKLCEHMESFCEDFGEIERRLAEKGVIIRHRVQKLPPSTEYAQILNVKDYEMTEEVEHFNNRRHSKKFSQPLHRRV